MKTVNPVRQLTEDEIWAAISYLEGGLDNREFNANIAVIILIICVVVAMLTLVLRVALS